MSVGTWNTFEPGAIEDGEHVCFFCAPNNYPPMPDGYTICARCGLFMWTGENDTMNEAMAVCYLCEIALAGVHT